MVCAHCRAHHCRVCVDYRGCRMHVSSNPAAVVSCRTVAMLRTEHAPCTLLLVLLLLANSLCRLLVRGEALLKGQLVVLADAVGIQLRTRLLRAERALRNEPTPQSTQVTIHCSQPGSHRHLAAWPRTLQMLHWWPWPLPMRAFMPALPPPALPALAAALSLRSRAIFALATFPLPIV